jgi:putative SOS response-associated peptidase YedK
MCYDVVSATRSLIKYARHRRDEIAYIESLEKKLELLSMQLTKHYHISGFAHPKLLVFTNLDPYEPQAMEWGLIPAWVKNKQQADEIANHTLNARGETIFEKPAFKNAAKKQRCLIVVDAFYEHHHFKGKTYPYHISMKDDSPMTLAGLWEEWTDQESGKTKKTISIVTCSANALMQKIHNNPKAENSRMPLILSVSEQDKWLQEIKSEGEEELVKQLIIPFPEEHLKVKTVRKLRGKNVVSDTVISEQEIIYPELLKSNINSGNLFSSDNEV